MDEQERKNKEEITEQELSNLKQNLKKTENRRKIMYAENELNMFKEDRKKECLSIFISIIKKYNLSSEDTGMLLEISQHLL